MRALEPGASNEVPVLLLAALLLVAVPLAGCTGSGGPSETTPTVGDGNETDDGNGMDGGNATDEGGDPNGTEGNATAGTLPTRVAYAGCTMHEAAFPFPRDQVASSIPEGFEPIDYDPTGTTVEIRLMGHFCDNATSDRFAIEDSVGELHAYLPVEPPSDLASAEAERHLIAFGSIVGREEIQELRSDWDLGDPELGSQSMTNLLGPAGRVGTYRAESDSVQITLHSRVEGTAPAVDARTSRIFGFEDLDDGNLTSVVDWTLANVARTEGVARGVVDLPGTDPGDLQAFAGFNAVMTGEAWHHFGDGLGFEMVRKDPSVVAG